MALECSRCGESLQEGWKACPECGTAAPRPACPGCTQPIESRWKVCPHCGVTLREDTATPELSFSDRARTRLGRATGDLPEGPVAAGARYRVESEVGRGGMGVVYRAHDERLGRVVALKRVLHRTDSLLVARFEKEARAAAALSHPNIVTIYDVGQDESGHYLAMEWLDGTGLDALLEKEGKLSPARAREIFAGVLDGIAYAHRRGIVHRDLKPSNLFVTASGNSKVLDFGLARAREDAGLSLTGYGMGTMDYAAPEQKRDAKNVDHRADVYSLGCTFYEMITGRRPPVHPSHLPEAFRRPLLAATDPDPERRPFSVSEFARALDEAHAEFARLPPTPPIVPVESRGIPPTLPKTPPPPPPLPPPPPPRSEVEEAAVEETTLKPRPRPPRYRARRSHREVGTAGPHYGRTLMQQLLGNGFRYLDWRSGRQGLYKNVSRVLIWMVALSFVGCGPGTMSRILFEDRALGQTVFGWLIVVWSFGIFEALAVCHGLRARASIRPYDHPEEGKPSPSVLKSVWLQVTLRGFAYLDRGSNRWVFYGTATFALLFLLSLAMSSNGRILEALGRELFGEREAFLVLSSFLFVFYLLGLVDVFLTSLRKRIAAGFAP